MLALTPQVRAERLVCSGRLVLVCTALVAVSLDAPGGIANRAATVPLLIVYAAYAVISAGAAWGLVPTFKVGRRASHVADVAVILLLNYVSDGPNSPFFAFFVFAVVSASMRFGSRAAAATAGVLVVSFAAFGIRETFNDSMSPSDWTRFLIRASYLGVIGVLIHYLTTYQERLRRELTHIAAWPRSRASTLADALSDLLPRAASLVRAERLLVIWDVADEPWIYTGHYVGGELFTEQQAPREFLPIVTDEVGDAAFVTRGAATRTTIVYGPDATPAAMGHLPVNANIVERYKLDAVLSVAFCGEIVNGRMFFVDVPNVTQDDVTLADIVTRLIGTSMEQHFLMYQLEGAAASEERMRVARDLHDGIVQSLAGAALHLHMLDQLIDEDPQQARATLKELGALLTQDQRELRSYIAQLRPSDAHGEEETSLGAKIEAAAARIERERSVQVGVSIDPHVETISHGMRAEAYHIVREAITNAAKHADPKQITVDLALRGDRLVARIADDGRGFPFHGRYDLETLWEMRRGPVTLKERVAALSGNLILDSSNQGTRLLIDLPTTLAEVRYGNTGTRRG